MGARHLGLGWETTYGTAVAPTLFLEVLRESVRRNPSYTRTEVVRHPAARSMDLEFAFAEGDIEVIANYQEVAHLLSWFLGVEPDTTGAGPYTHTLPPSTGLPATGRAVHATAEIRRDGSLAWRYAGGKCSAFALSQNGGQVNCSLRTLFKSEADQGTPATATYLDNDRLKKVDTTVKFDGTDLVAKSFAFNASWDYDRPDGLGSSSFVATPTDTGLLVVTGSVEVYFTDKTEYAKFVADTDVDVQIVSSDGTHSLTLNMNNCRLTQATPPMQGRERLMATYEYESFYDTDATANLQAVVVNDQSTVNTIP